MTNQRLYPGWLIVIGGFLIMATCYSVFVNCFNLFLIPITKSLMISRMQFSVNSSIAAIIGVFASLFIGKLVDRYDARLIGSLCVLLTVLDMVGWGFITAIWQMYILSIVTGLCVVSGSRLLISILITNWFHEKSGLALSLALSGSGVGGTAMSLIISSLITTQGWRMAFFMSALITFLLAFPLSLLAFRTRPSAIDLKLYHSAKKPSRLGEPNQPDNNVPHPTTSHARKPIIWLLIICFLFTGLINGGIIVNISANFVDAGYSFKYAADIVSLEMFILIFAKIILGFLYDRYGVLIGTLVGSLTTLFAILSLIFARLPIAPYLFALSFGFGTCLGTVAPPLLIVHIFGSKSSAHLIGYVTAAEMFGVAIGAVLMGHSFDKTGSYTFGWIILLIICFLMTLLFIQSIRLARSTIKA
ncbi:MAG: MFS transporter [Sporolactobacillus sp.]